MKNHGRPLPSGDVEALRQMAIDNVLALRRENSARISDPFWTSYTGYSYGIWADRGYSIALRILEKTNPQAGEAGADYLRRVIELVRAQRDEYRVNDADEDGACSGALDAAMWAIIEALPQESPASEPSEQALSDPAPEAEWEVWYRDTFDRECPPSVDVRGRGLVKGLMKLWARHLFETVRPGGGRGFSRFNLWWDGRSVSIKGDWTGATRLREWLFGAKKQSTKGYVEEAEPRLLEQIAVTHANLVLAGGSSDEILAAAASSANRDAFEAWLLGQARGGG